MQPINIETMNNTPTQNTDRAPLWARVLFDLLGVVAVLSLATWAAWKAPNPFREAPGSGIAKG